MMNLTMLQTPNIPLITTSLICLWLLLCLVASLPTYQIGGDDDDNDGGGDAPIEMGLADRIADIVEKLSIKRYTDSLNTYSLTFTTPTNHIQPYQTINQIRESANFDTYHIHIVMWMEWLQQCPASC
jgi:hypothetical protein